MVRSEGWYQARRGRRTRCFLGGFHTAIHWGGRPPGVPANSRRSAIDEDLRAERNGVVKSMPRPRAATGRRSGGGSATRATTAPTQPA
jgi:hypothetical protein